jgi:hypothetical protein
LTGLYLFGAGTYAFSNAIESITVYFVSFNL